MSRPEIAGAIASSDEEIVDAVDECSDGRVEERATTPTRRTAPTTTTEPDRPSMQILAGSGFPFTATVADAGFNVELSNRSAPPGQKFLIYQLELTNDLPDRSAPFSAGSVPTLRLSDRLRAICDQTYCDPYAVSVYELGSDGEWFGVTQVPAGGSTTLVSIYGPYADDASLGDFYVVTEDGGRLDLG